MGGSVAPTGLENLRRSYFSDLGHDILGEFFVPILQRADRYDRITGDFTSAFLRAGARGFSSFFGREGRMRLVTNGRFTASDIDAIKAGVPVEEVAAEALDREVEQLLADPATIENDHLQFFSWLLRAERLQIRVAVLRNPQGYARPAGSHGDFHNKVGVFRFPDGQTAAFLGGLNESLRAYTQNSESITCAYSWRRTDDENLDDWRKFFDKVWNGQTKKSHVFDFPEALRRRLITEYEFDGAPAPPQTKPYGRLESASPVDLWRHQDAAIKKFLPRECGVLEMATGTGKTRTALKIVEDLASSSHFGGVIVATFGNDLLNQWYREIISHFGPSSFHIYRFFGGYKDSLQFLNDGNSNRAILISYQNLGLLLQQDVQGSLKNCILVCDEVHNLGAPSLMQSLQGLGSRIRWRLGLSATPERAYDEPGNRFIETEIGPVIYEFTLRDAIKRGILCEFDYVPVEYEFEDEDRDRIQAVYAKVAASRHKGKPMSQEEVWTELARVRKTARGKLGPFKKILHGSPELLGRSLIFVEDMEYGELVQEVIMDYNMNYHTYYADDDEKNLARFARGDLDCLITCKKLSEGIDIQSVMSIILFASDRSKLTTIQRMGRALRRDPDRPDKRATVVDFLRLSDLSPQTEPGGPGRGPSADAARKEWLEQLATTRRSK